MHWCITIESIESAFNNPLRFQRPVGVVYMLQAIADAWLQQVHGQHSQLT